MPDHGSQSGPAGKGCVVYDVIISTAAFESLRAREGMRNFLLELSFSQVGVRGSAGAYLPLRSSIH